MCSAMCHMPEVWHKQDAQFRRVPISVSEKLFLRGLHEKSYIRISLNKHNELNNLKKSHACTHIFRFD